MNTTDTKTHPEQNNQQEYVAEAKSMLDLHEQLGSAYLDSTYPDDAYLVLVKAYEAELTDEQRQQTELLLSRTCAYQAKILLKQGSDSESEKKLVEALDWSDKSLEGPNQLDADDYSKRGGVQIRLGQFEDAMSTFKIALEKAEDPSDAGEVLLQQHRLYAVKQSPYFDVEHALDLLDGAIDQFNQTEDEERVRVAERYKLTLLARSRKLGRLASQGIKAVSGIAKDRKQISQRIKRRK